MISHKNKTPKSVELYYKLRIKVTAANKYPSKVPVHGCFLYQWVWGNSVLKNVHCNGEFLCTTNTA